MALETQNSETPNTQVELDENPTGTVEGAAAEQAPAAESPTAEIPSSEPLTDPPVRQTERVVLNDCIPVFTNYDMERIWQQRADELNIEIRSQFTDALQQSTSQIATLQAQNAELLKQLQTQANERKESDAARRLAERDSKLREALSSVRVDDRTICLRYLQPELVQDADGDWQLRDGKSMQSITPEAIEKILPDALKLRKLLETGSGTGQGAFGNRRPPIDPDIEHLRSEEVRLKRQFDASRGSDTQALIDISKVRKALKELQGDTHRVRGKRR